MRKIIALCNDTTYIDKLRRFCNTEELRFSSVASLDEIAKNDSFILITDHDMDNEEFEHILTPVCFICRSSIGKTKFCIPDTFTHISLRLLLDAIFHGSLFRSFESSITPLNVCKQYEIKNDYHNIDKIVYNITRDLTVFFSFSNLEKVRVGISEMLTNAIEHGNLCINTEEKSIATEGGTLKELIDSRIIDDKYRDKVVLLTISYDTEKVSISILDQGDGFDINKVPDPTDDSVLLKLHGRGIFMTRMYFSQIIYNEKGNEVTLVKHFDEIIDL